MDHQFPEETVFKRWVKDVLRWRDQIISKVETRYWQKTHKFEIRITKTVKGALDVDKATGTNFWELAIQKEIDNVRIDFEKGAHKVEDMRNSKVPPLYQEIICHMAFDIKMDGNFTRKYCFVAGGHTTDTPASITYSSVVSRDSVRIALMITALNDIDVFAADIGNAYLNDPCPQKIWTKSGPEFVSKQVCVMLIVRSLYRLKYSGASWRAMLAETMVSYGLGYTYTDADKDVCIKREVLLDGKDY